MRPHRIEVPPFIVELATVDASKDPAIVLRRIAEQFVPFVQKTLAENLAVYMFSRAQTSIVLLSIRAIPTLLGSTGDIGIKSDRGHR